MSKHILIPTDGSLVANKAASIPFTSVVAKALTAYEGIIAAAKKRKCDVIFMASHGCSNLKASHRVVFSQTNALRSRPGRLQWVNSI